MNIKCTSCGATQTDVGAKNCNYCGSVIEIESAKDNYLSSLKSENGNLMAMAETAIEASNYEEALQYFNRVLEKNISNSDAWLGKGIAIVYTSKIGDLKINEAIAYWKNALKHAPNQEAMGKRIAKEINEVVNKFYPSLENHFIQFKSLDNSFQELVGKFIILEKAQDYATQLDPQNIKYYETGYGLCKRVIDIPKQYVIAEYTAAGVLGLGQTVMGAIEGNKYKQVDAALSRANARVKAKEKQKEIIRVSQSVYALEEKYVEKINKLNPSRNLTSSRIAFENSEEGKKHEKEQKKIEDAEQIKEVFKKEGFLKGLKNWWANQSIGMKILLITVYILIIVGIIFSQKSQ